MVGAGTGALGFSSMCTVLKEAWKDMALPKIRKEMVTCKGQSGVLEMESLRLPFSVLCHELLTLAVLHPAFPSCGFSQLSGYGFLD